MSSETPRTPAARVVGVDSLRAFAATAVFLCHLGGYWSLPGMPHFVRGLLSNGSHGVDVFIVLSGFLLAIPVTRTRHVAIRTFYGRRALRILPPYWVALIAVIPIAMIPATAHLIVAAPATPTDVVVHLFGAQTWFPPTLGTINGSLWSVSLEIQLYAVFPLLVWLWRRAGIGTLLGAALGLCILWNLAGFLGTPYLGDMHALPACLIQFVIGMACAELFYRGRAPGLKIVLPTLAVLLVVAIFVYSTGLPFAIGKVAWGLVGAFCILALISPIGTALNNSPIERFGLRSFSFYLVHQPIILLLALPVSLLPGGWAVRLFLAGAVAFTLTALVSTVLYRGVEKPSHRYAQRRFRTPRPQVAPTEPAPLAE